MWVCACVCVCAEEFEIISFKCGICLFLFFPYIFLSNLRNIHLKKFLNPRNTSDKILVPRNTHKKIFEPTRYTHKKKILDPRRHDGTRPKMSWCPRNLAHTWGNNILRYQLSYEKIFIFIVNVSFYEVMNQKAETCSISELGFKKC